MSHTENDQILESIYERFDIYKKTAEEISLYFILDENKNHMESKGKIFWDTKLDAELALFDLVYKQFEEIPQP
tara:strand:+ start:629 stop:847 length:219 start_codon:yes stop_codon:yes gene_type:complete